MPNRKEVTDEKIIALFVDAHLSLRNVAKLVGLSHGAIRKRLIKRGIVPMEYENVVVECGFCGRELRRQRSKVRAQKDQYCNKECASAKMTKQHGKTWAVNRLARAVVSQHYKLLPENVVAYKNKNAKDNSLQNLIVFNNEEEYKIYLSTGVPDPIWPTGR